MSNIFAVNGDAPPEPRPFHCAEQVRDSKNISKRCLAKKLGISISNLELLLNPMADLRLRQLEWLASALGVTTVDLILDHKSEDAGPGLTRKTLGELFTTASGLADAADSIGVKRMTGLLVSQLEELATGAGIAPASLQPNSEDTLPFHLLNGNAEESAQESDEDD